MNMAAADAAIRELQESGFDMKKLSKEGAYVMTQQPTITNRRVRFDLTTEPGSQVFVAGTFNNWDPAATPMKDNPGSGHCKATVMLPAGRHEYKFVVNGGWLEDPKCPDAVPNAYGSMNSVLNA